ncbi:hypothetical protein VPH35_050368 [Triticum aestivum]
MVAAGDPLQGQARPGQACWPPSRVAGSAATTAASSSPEATMPLKADLAPLALTPLVRALVHHIVEAGRARAGQGGARARGVETRDLHLAPRRCRPPARQHAQPHARWAQARAAVQIRESRHHLPRVWLRGQRDVVPVH